MQPRREQVAGLHFQDFSCYAPNKGQAPFEPARGDWSSLFTTKRVRFSHSRHHTDSLTCGRIDPKGAYLRRKPRLPRRRTTPKLVDSKDKRVARSVAEMLNAQSIGGRKDERHDDVLDNEIPPEIQVDCSRASWCVALNLQSTHFSV